MKHYVLSTVQTSKKIAAVSRGTSYLELLDEARYDSSKYEDDEVAVEVAMASPD